MKINPKSLPTEIQSIQKTLFYETENQQNQQTQNKNNQSKTLIGTNSTKLPINLTKRNEILSLKIIEDCQNLPFWIPNEEAYFDFDIKEVVTLIESAQTEEELNQIIE